MTGDAPDDSQNAGTPPRGVKNRTLKAGMWSFGMRGASRVLQLVRTVVLAKLLSPADFGLMGIAIITLSLVDTFSRTGFHQALVQKKEDVTSYYNTAWTVEIARSGLLGAALFFGAPFVASFFDTPDVVAIIRVLAASVAIAGLTNVAIAEFDRELDFRKIFQLEVVERGADVVAAITFAFVLGNVWALVIGSAVGKVARVAGSFWLARRPLRLELDRVKAAEMYKYGRWIFGSIILWFLTSELDDILVGRMMGETDLGLYRMAYVISQSMLTEVAMAINLVVFPAFARIQEEREKLTQSLRSAIHLIGFISFPAAVLFVMVGADLTRILLGPQWLPMVPALQVLAVAGAARAVSSVATIMFEGSGSPGITTRLELIRLALMASLLYPLIAEYGLVGAAIATIASSIVVDVITLIRAARYLETARREMFEPLIWPMLNSAVTAGAFYIFAGVPGSDVGAWGLAGIVAGAGGVYLLAALAAVRSGTYSDATDLVSWVKAGRH